VAATIPHLLPPEMVKRSVWEDRHERRVNNWITPWDFREPIDVGVVMVPLSKTSILPTGCHGAPNALRQAFQLNTTYSPDYDVDMTALRVRELGEVGSHTTDILRSLRMIEEAAAAVFAHEPSFFPVFVGGDHAVTAPLVRGWLRAQPGLRLGMIHFDAHNDVRHLDDDGPSNGTPIRQVMQAGVPGRRIVQIGIHGWMNSRFYKEYALGQGMTIYTARQVRALGIDRVVREALARASDGAEAIYVTVDIDVLTFPYGIGTGASSPEGMTPYELLDALFALGQDPRVRCFDLVEIDPTRDVAGMTAKTGATALLTFLGGLYTRLHPQSSSSPSSS
jgi:formiminoglutamase